MLRASARKTSGASLGDQSDAATGWNAPPNAPWLTAVLDQASQTYYGKPAAYLGEGGTIPFMGMLGKYLPDAQYLLVGVLGPESNAHGPDEFLHLPTVRRVTAVVADVLAAHATAEPT